MQACAPFIAQAMPTQHRGLAVYFSAWLLGRTLQADKLTGSHAFSILKTPFEGEREGKNCSLS